MCIRDRHVGFHDRQQLIVKVLFFLIGKLAVSGFAEIAEVGQAEAFAVYNFIAEAFIIFPQVENCLLYTSRRIE